jgi:YVTN family beta-propeller protein
MHPSFKRRIASVLSIGLLSSVILLGLLASVTSASVTAPMTAGPAEFVTITATVGLAPKAIGINPNTGYVYVANSDEGSVTILQGTAVVTTVSVGDSPRSIGVNPATGNVYVGDYVGNHVAILNGTSHVTDSPSIAQPNLIAVNPATGFAYVGSQYFNGVVVFSATQVVTTVMLGPSGSDNHAYDIQIDPNTGNVYVSTIGADYQPVLQVLNGLQIVATIPVSSVGRIGIHPTRGYIYLTNTNNGISAPGTVAVISGTAVIGEVPVGTDPRTITVDPVRGYVYVANRSDNTVSVISETDVITTVSVGDTPYAIAVDATTGFAYVTHLDANVFVLRGSEVLAKLKSGMGARSIAINPVNHGAYVANEYSNSVSVFLYQLPNRVFLPVVMRKP